MTSITANGLDLVKGLFTYAIALVVVIGGFYIIFATRSDPTATDTRLMIAGFIGSALTFAFGAEIQTRTSRQQATATVLGSQYTNGAPPPAGPAG